MARPFLQWRSIRSSIVCMPLITKKELKGLGVAPQSFEEEELEISAISSLFPITAPPITSPWPLIYFVMLCRTRSAPSASGYCTGGGANVLSTTTLIFFSPAIWATAEISVIFMVGLVGVSK